MNLPCTFSTQCFVCGGTGMRVVHQQGDLVPGYPHDNHTRVFWGSTLYETCECRIIRSPVVEESEEL